MKDELTSNNLGFFKGEQQLSDFEFILYYVLVSSKYTILLCS